MFRHQVEDLRKTCERLVRQVQPPLHVFILREQAEFLKVPYVNRGLPPEVRTQHEQMHREVDAAGLRPRRVYGPVVMVKFLDLYKRAMEGNIKGVDENAGTKDSGSKPGD